MTLRLWHFGLGNTMGWRAAAATQCRSLSAYSDRDPAYDGAGWAGPRAQPQAACRQYRFNFRIRPLSRLWYDQPMILPGWLERRTGNYLTLRLGTSCVRPRFKRTRSHQTHRAPAQGTRACSKFAGVHYGSGPDKLHSMWQNSDQTVERTF